eukprot:sb/3465117/
MKTLLLLFLTIGAAEGGTAEESTSNFGLPLLSTLPTNTNTLISPFSINTCLAMVREGSGGNTRSQLDSAFGWSGDVAGGFRSMLETIASKDGEQFNLTSSNRIYVADGFPVKESYTTTLEDNFGASSVNMNFTDGNAVDVINGWVEGETNGKIKDLLGEIDPATVVILINTIYFMGQWGHSFTRTNQETFYLDSTLAVQAPTMHVQERFLHYSNNDVEVVVLPYKDSPVTMVIIKPVERAAVLEDTSYDVISSWLDNAEYKELELSMPKFSYEAKMDNLVAVLASDFGVTDLFDPSKADLTGMSDTNEIFVSKIVHQAFIAVDENGTEAAAATAVLVETTSVREPEEPIRVMINQPFQFLIKHGDIILFAGRVTNPESVGSSYEETRYISSHGNRVGGSAATIIALVSVVMRWW